MKKRCLIISGGEFCEIKDYTDSDFVIACDRGYEYAQRCGITPDLCLGDFDSYGGTVENCEVHRCRPEKDDTDTMLAIKEGLKMGFDRISLRCALGGSMDHLIANIQSLVYGAQYGAVMDITDSNNYLQTLLPGRHMIKKVPGSYLSFFALNGPVEGLSLSGVKYPLEGCELTGAFPLCVSNEWTAAYASVQFKSGVLLTVISDRKKKY